MRLRVLPVGVWALGFALAAGTAVAVAFAAPAASGSGDRADAAASVVRTDTATEPTTDAGPVSHADEADAATTATSDTAGGADAAALPEARYDAAIPALVDVDGLDVVSAEVHRIATDLTLYDAPGGTPVARLAATDFLGGPTPVVVVARKDGWSLVLTPARSIRPSEATADRPAAAQTAGWTRIDGVAAVTPTQRIVVSTADQTLSIVSGDTVEQTFPAAVGTPATPSPTGVVGYLQQRYVDPAQGTDGHPIQLTSLHSTVADDPYGGSDGGLIGIHYSDDRTGAISHGCIRVGEDALAAVDALPLGTLIVVQ